MEVIAEQVLNTRAVKARKYPRPFTNNPFPEPPSSSKKIPNLQPQEKRLKSVAAPPTTYFNEQEFPEDPYSRELSHPFALNAIAGRPFCSERGSFNEELDLSGYSPPLRPSDPTTASTSSRPSILSPKENMKNGPLQWKRPSIRENGDAAQKVFSLSPVHKGSPSPIDSDPSALDFLRSSPEGKGANLPLLRELSKGPAALPTTSRLESGQIGDLRKQHQKGHNS